MNLIQSLTMVFLCVGIMANTYTTVIYVRLLKRLREGEE